MSNQVCIDSPNNCLIYFRNHIKNFGEVKKVISFLNNENFLLTDYKLSCPSTCTVIENTNGDIIEFTGLNCGYQGAGPNKTEELLVELGIERTIAEKLKHQASIILEFNNQHSSWHEKEILNGGAAFFQMYRQSFLVGYNLDKHTFVDIITKTVKMIHPEKNNMNGLINCLHVMKPVLLEFTTKANGYIESYGSEEASDSYNINNTIANTGGYNFIIRGEKFHVYASINTNQILSVSNVIHVYLTKNPLYTEHHVMDTVMLDFRKKQSENSRYTLYHFLANYVLHKKTQTYYKRIISDKELQKYE